jgi:hypothetical protein
MSRTRINIKVKIRSRNIFDLGKSVIIIKIQQQEIIYELRA